MLRDEGVRLSAGPKGYTIDSVELKARRWTADGE